MKASEPAGSLGPFRDGAAVCVYSAQDLLDAALGVEERPQAALRRRDVMGEVPHAFCERAEQPEPRCRLTPGVDRVEVLVQGDAADLGGAVAERLQPAVLPESLQQAWRPTGTASGSRGGRG